MNTYTALESRIVVHRVDGIVQGMHTIEWPARLFYEIVRQGRTEECQQFICDFATTIRDYLAMACIGEARHATYAKLNTNYSEKTPRSIAYADVLEYSPDSIFEFCEFSFTHWNGLNRYTPPSVNGNNGVGGSKWALVAKRGSYYGRISPTLYVDHILDLSHNRTLVWNKPVIFPDASMMQLRSFLDARAQSPVHAEIEYPYQIELVQIDWKNKPIEKAHIYKRKDLDTAVYHWMEIGPPFCHGQCDKLHTWETQSVSTENVSA